jgi:arylsulfatase B/arylsulfatase I/J
VASKENSKPNFVFILADDLGWNSIGYQDYDLTFASPFITELAKKGVIMSNYYGQEICTPSRAALLTGRYPLSIGSTHAHKIIFTRTYN